MLREYSAQYSSLNVPDKGLLKCNGLQRSTCTLHCFQTYQIHVAEIMTSHNNGIWIESFTKCLEICPINKETAIRDANSNDFPVIKRTVQFKCTCFSKLSFSISGQALHDNLNGIVDVEHFKSAFVQSGTRWTYLSEKRSGTLCSREHLPEQKKMVNMFGEEQQRGFAVLFRLVG